MTNFYVTSEQLDRLGLALWAATSREEAILAYKEFVADVNTARAPVSTGRLQANGFPPAPPVPAPNADFVQPISEDAHQRREWNLKFNPFAEPAPPLEPVDAEVTKAAP